MDGYQVCHEVKHTLQLTDTCIVLLTAKGQEADQKKGYEAGADIYMTKPFDPDELLAKAQDILGLQAL
jgi:two-component system, OmpR family, alkaline phosphatase synthesis response regulator PhoP